MATQEERLLKLEFDLQHFKTETLWAYKDMAFEVTMLKGLTEDSIRRLSALKAQVDQRFEMVDQRFDAVDQRFDAVDQRFDAVDQQITEMRLDISELNTRFDQQKELLLQVLARLPEKP